MTFVTRLLALAAVTAAAVLAPAADAVAQDPPGQVKVTFTYGSEKEAWVRDVTQRFNAAGVRVNGKRVVVEAIAMGSGECMQEVAEGRRQAHVVSPASRVFIDLANAGAGPAGPVVGPARSLVVSPVVIAMWRPMAEALGYGQRPIGWADVLEMVRRPEGWAAYDFPKWGQFKFGHTHPEFSNSGLLAVIAQVYAAAGKTDGLTAGDVDRPSTARFVGEVQRSVVHYGSSTGFFGKKMFKGGPEFLSAAVLYENMVIESYDAKFEQPVPVVAIYPKEGTFWSDHPAAVVRRPWVGADHRAAAEAYVDFLLARPQQERAMAFGFRPADTTVALAAPFDAAHGVDPAEPRALLAVPDVATVRRVLDLWRKQKKQAAVVLAIDVSGSMNEDGRMDRARPAAAQVIDMLGDDDRVSVLTFGTDVRWVAQDAVVREKRRDLIAAVNGLRPFGRTALYDGVHQAYEHARKAAAPGQISVVLVLSDGEDTTSKLKLADLKGRIRFDPDRSPTLIFTVGYGGEADATILQQISDSTQAKFYPGTPETIRKVLEDNASFFGAGPAAAAAAGP